MPCIAHASVQGRRWRGGALVLALLTAASCSPDDGESSAESSENSATTGAGGDAGFADETGGVYGRIPEIVEEVEPSIVAVLTDVGEGSGVVYRSDGVVVTNQHVVAGAGEVVVAFADGERAAAEVVATDEIVDLAVLRVERDMLPAAEFARDLPRVGELAVALGNPLGFENTATAGIVSGLHRSIPGSAVQSLALVDLIQTDAPISPGNSGGALVGAAGDVIGINVAYIPPAASAVSLGFAIPSETVVRVVDELLEDGDADHVFFGVQPAPITPAIAQQFDLEMSDGVLVLQVVDGGPADVGGVRAGDVIVEIDGGRVRTVEEFLGALRRRRPGETVIAIVVRDGEQIEIEVVLEERAT